MRRPAPTLPSLATLPSLVPLLLLALAGCRTAPDPDVAQSPAHDVDPSRAPGAASNAAIARPHVGTDPGHAGAGTPLSPREGNELAAFALGCFWGSEDTFRQVPGVVATAVGYTGGHTDNPDYDAVCSHTTGHAEAVLVEFDPKKVRYERLLEVFFATHDPTQLNRQGNDIGTQYRSAIFPLDAGQADAARAGITRAASDWPAPIVTTIENASDWYPAEDYHQAYWEGEGQRNPYCMAVIPPKLAKLRKGFGDRLRA